MVQSVDNNHEFTISDYLLHRLKEHGAAHIFGVCGDYIMPFFERLDTSEVQHVGTCNELNAGYAADGYARLTGLGAAVVTGGVGALSLINAVAGAYVEDVPMVVVAGTVDSSLYESAPRLHHMVPGNYRAPVRMFEEVTAANLLLLDAETAPDQIDEAFCLCLTLKKPVYIEISMDVQTSPCRRPLPLDLPVPSSDNANLAALVADVIERIGTSKRTVVLPGHEVQRFGLQEQVVQMISRSGLATASLMWGKEGYLECLPECVGFYQGALSQPEVREYVEGADTLLFLGAFETDLNTGLGTAVLPADKSIWIANGEANVDGKLYSNIALTDFVRALSAVLPEKVTNGIDDRPRQSFAFSTAKPYHANTDAAMTMNRVFERMAHFIRPGDVLASDTSSSVNLAHTQFPENVVPVASSYWGSMGHGFGACLGASFAVEAPGRVIAVEGDGSFLMTAQELSTMGRYGKPTIVVLLNNKGYTIERIIHDGPFNDVPHWQFHKLPDVFGGGRGIEVRTEGEFEEALAVAENYNEAGPLLIEVHLETLNVTKVFQPLVEMFK